ncbi:UNVERIFIED_CONTAM: hypothetical protein FKN15_032758 [Acipenser sinensis]
MSSGDKSSSRPVRALKNGRRSIWKGWPDSSFPGPGSGSAWKEARLCCVDTLSIKQSPAFLSAKAGASMKLSCEVTDAGSSDPYVYWYRQDPHSGPQLLFSSLSALSVDPSNLGQFTASRPNSSHFFLESTGVDSLSVQQSPAFLSKQTGDSVKISCAVTGYDTPYIYWYRQDPHTGPQLLFYSSATDHVDPTRLGQFIASRPNSSHFFLESTDVAVNDTAVYYCAGRTHSVDTLSVHQSPPFLSMLRGTHLKLSCFITGHSNPDIYWYRQSPHTGPQLLFYSSGTDLVDPTRLGQFTASRPDSSHFFLESTGVDTLSIQQSPAFLSAKAGASMKLSCEVTDAGSATLYVYWYRQDPHSGPQLLFSSLSPPSVDPSNLGQFTASRPDSSHFFLESTGVAVNDSAVYYCAGRTHSDSNTDTLCTKTTPALSLSCPCFSLAQFSMSQVMYDRGVLGKFCGQEGSPKGQYPGREPIMSPGNSLKVIFQSDISNQETHLGFLAHYQAIVVDCGAPLSLLNGQFEYLAGRESENVYQSVIKYHCNEPYYKIVPAATGDVCGMPRNPIPKVQRILGGSTAPRGSFPWQVLLVNAGRAGAFLITDQWIMTAASNIYPKHKYQRDSLSDLIQFIDIYLGDTNVEILTYMPRLEIEGIFIHPGFQEAALQFDNDIALIKLRHRVTVNETVMPLCLPTAGSLYQPGVMGYVSGWGITEHNKLSNQLKYVALPVVDQHQCNASINYRSQHAMKNIPQLTDNMFCAGRVEGGEDTCSGDSGGAFTLLRGVEGAGEEYYAAGIISWGVDCGRKGNYEVYTRVERYLGWINQTIQGN